MNVYQRLILIGGAVAFVVALVTTPKYVVVQGVLRGQRFNYDPEDRLLKGLPATRDPSSAAIRGATVIGTTVFLYFALSRRDRRKRAIEHKPPRHSV